MGTLAVRQLTSKQGSCRQEPRNKKKEKGYKTLYRETQQRGALAIPHPHDSSWVSSTAYSNSQNYNVVFLKDRTTKNFQAYRSSTKPPQIQATRPVTSLYFHFPPLFSSLLPKKLLSQSKKHFGFVIRHWLFCYLSPSYFEIKPELFAFFFSWRKAVSKPNLLSHTTQVQGMCRFPTEEHCGKDIPYTSPGFMGTGGKLKNQLRDAINRLALFYCRNIPLTVTLPF